MRKKRGVLRDICGLDWIRRKTWPPLPRRPCGTVTLVDLFCGCGGLTLGVWEAARLNRQRLDIRLAVDDSPDTIAVYRDNFRLSPDVARLADINEVLPGDLGDRPRAAERRLRDAVGHVDVLVAGPPCQGHSDLNNHTRRADPRNGLYLRVIRAVELLKPKVVLIENVGAVIHDRSSVIQKSLEHLERLQYGVAHQFVHTDSLGLPQRRKRHILLAIRGNGLDVESLFPQQSTKPVPLREFILDLVDEPEKHDGVFRTPSRMTPRNRRRVDYLFSRGVYDLPNSQRPDCHRNGHSYKSMYGRLRWDVPAQTITTGFGSMGQGRFVHPAKERLITPHEAARIQGLPDFYDFSGVEKRTAIQAMIGNLVPPAVSAALLTSVLQHGICCPENCNVKR